MSTQEVIPTGHTQVKQDKNGRTRSYWIFWRDAEGKHGRKLGPAHVKDSGRRTPRGAVIWRAGDGQKPTPEHLTPREADTRLAEVLVDAPRRPDGTTDERFVFRDAVEGWLDERTATRGLKRSTRMDYEDLFERLYRDLGEETPIEEFADRDLTGYFRSFQAQRIVGLKRAGAARAEGARVLSVRVARWTARPAASVPVEVSTRREAVEVAKRLGGRWKHVAPGVYRVTPPGAQRARRVSRGEARRLEQEGCAIERRETRRWVICTPAAPQTRNKYRDLFAAVLDFAAQRGWLDRNPLDAVARVSRRADRRRILRRDDFYDPSETARLLLHAPGDFERAFWLCGFHAGFRLPGEAQGLRWGAVDFDASVIRIYDNWVRNAADGTKTSDSEAIPMTPELRAALWTVKLRSYRTGDADYVFTLDALGQPAADKPLREAFRLAGREAGLKAIPMYNTRHSFGTALAREGVPARTIQALMRHARLTTTEQYMAYAPQPDLAARLADALTDTSEAPRATQRSASSAVEQFYRTLEEELPAKWLRVVRNAAEKAGISTIAN